MICQEIIICFLKFMTSLFVNKNFEPTFAFFIKEIHK